METNCTAVGLCIESELCVRGHDVQTEVVVPIRVSPLMRNARGRGGRGSCFGGRGRRRCKEREARGEKMPLRGVVEGFSFPHKAAANAPSAFRGTATSSSSQGGREDERRDEVERWNLTEM